MSDSTETTQQKSNCYKLLSIFFHEPEVEMWAQEELCSQLTDLLINISPEAGYKAENMSVMLKDSGAEQMKIDYAALFLGPYDLIAPPYGSVYLENTKRVMGDSTVAVLDKYRETGLRLDVQEPADHIAIELEYMHHLYSIEVDAFRTGDREKEQWAAGARKKFLTSFLSPWIPPFCRNIRTGADTMFYRNLADCLEIFIEQDASLNTTAGPIEETTQ